MTHPNAYAAIQSRGNFGKVDYNEKTTHTLNRVRARASSSCHWKEGRLAKAIKLPKYRP